MEKTIFDFLITVMLDAEAILDLNGTDKKNYAWFESQLWIVRFRDNS